VLVSVKVGVLASGGVSVHNSDGVSVSVIKPGKVGEGVRVAQGGKNSGCPIYRFELVKQLAIWICVQGIP
jgi:hypothetical protein